MKSIFAVALVAAGVGFGANAETFTFSSTATDVARVAVPGMNNSVQFAGVANISGTTSMGAKTLTTTGQCASWPATPPVGIFQDYGMCTASDPGGTFYIRYGCNPAKEPMQDNCVGGLWGTGGVYAGRTGTLSWHGRAAADGKGGTSDGAGQWGD